MNMEVTNTLQSLEVFVHRMIEIGSINMYADKIISLVEVMALASEFTHACAGIKASADAQLTDQYDQAALFGLSMNAVYEATAKFLFPIKQSERAASDVTEDR